MSDESEAHLIARMKDGEESAFRLIVDAHLGPLTHYVLRMTNNNLITEDLVQDTFVKFWVSRDSYDPAKAKLTTWLHRIAHNLCIDYFRTRKSDPAGIPEAHQSGPIQAGPIQAGPIQAGPDSTYETAINNEQLADALMGLKENQRSALVMCHYQGMPQTDVANILGMTLDALEASMRRSRKKLRNALEAKDIRMEESQ